MDAKDFSKWIWDVAKYVLSAIIITSFLGSFKKPAMLYIMSSVVLGLLALAGAYFNKRSKKK